MTRGGADVIGTLGRSSPVQTSEPVEHFDVLIVGAGISGIGAAYHLTQQCPARASSCSKRRRASAAPGSPTASRASAPTATCTPSATASSPGPAPPIATAAEILKYMDEVIDENDLGRHIRYRHQIDSRDWSSDENLLDHRGDAHRHRRGGPRSPPASSGCARATTATPRATRRSGRAWSDFKGRIVHPQTWPDDLDYAGKRVVVIGSGATAATLVPAIAADCAHITMLQRSPTYFTDRPQRHRARRRAARAADRRGWIHEIVRRKILHDQAASRAARSTEPEAVKQELLAAVRAYLGPDYDVEHALHAALPALAAAPRLRSRTATCSRPSPTGKASVVTDEIERFTETGILLKSGDVARSRHHRHRHRLQPQRAGRHRVHRRRRAARLRRHRHLPRHDVHRRAQPGLGLRLLPRELDPARRPGRRLRLPAARPHAGEGREQVVVALRPEDADMPLLPWIDPENFNPGYVMRGLHLLPKRGDKPEWAHTQDYWTREGRASGHRPRRRGLRVLPGLTPPGGPRATAARPACAARSQARSPAFSGAARRTCPPAPRGTDVEHLDPALLAKGQGDEEAQLDHFGSLKSRCSSSQRASSARAESQTMASV